VVPRLSETPGTIRSLGPRLGADTDQVLQELLGCSPDEVAELRRKRVV
jgi:succinyl-CoA:(S)-malate CoA-transferase subunit B